MRAAISKAEQLVTELERDLGASTGPWLFGDRFTLADLFWAVSLYRFLWLGYSGFWKDGAGKPRVEAYSNRLFARPSVKDAIIQWPGHPPGENVIHLLSNPYRQQPRRPQATRSIPGTRRQAGPRPFHSPRLQADHGFPIWIQTRKSTSLQS